MASTVSEPSDVDKSISVIESIVRRRVFVGIVTAVVAALALVLAFIMTPTYRSTVMFSVVAENDQLDLGRITRQVPIAALAGFLGSPRGRSREEALAVLRSREFTERFIREHGLLPRMFEKRWEPERKAWKSEEDAPEPGEAYRFFDRKVRHITEDRVTGIVTLTVDWRDRAEASAWANALISDSDRRLRELDMAEATRSQRYLEQEMGRTNIVELETALARLMEEQIKRAMFAKVREQFAFKVIDPAVPADADDFVKPNRLAMLLVGAMLGFALGAGLAVVQDIRGR